MIPNGDAVSGLYNVQTSKGEWVVAPTVLRNVVKLEDIGILQDSVSNIRLL